MRKIWLSILTGFAAVATGLAQESPTPYRPNSDVRVTGFGATITEFSTINDRFASFWGAGVGAVFNRRFYLAGYAVGYTGRDLKHPEGNADLELAFGHAGLWTGYTFLPEKPLHFTLGTKLGWGGLCWYDPDNDEDVPVDGTFVWTPEAGVEFNATRFLRINLTGGYRLVYDVDLAGASDRALRGPSAAISFKFGLY
jgi:hypothetical protein